MPFVGVHSFKSELADEDEELFNEIVNEIESLVM